MLRTSSHRHKSACISPHFRIRRLFAYQRKRRFFELTPGHTSKQVHTILACHPAGRCFLEGGALIRPHPLDELQSLLVEFPGNIGPSAGSCTELGLTRPTPGRSFDKGQSFLIFCTGTILRSFDFFSCPFLTFLCFWLDALGFLVSTAGASSSASPSTAIG